MKYVAGRLILMSTISVLLCAVQQQAMASCCKKISSASDRSWIFENIDNEANGKGYGNVYFYSNNTCGGTSICARNGPCTLNRGMTYIKYTTKDAHRSGKIKITDSVGASKEFVFKNGLDCANIQPTSDGNAQAVLINQPDGQGSFKIEQNCWKVNSEGHCIKSLLP